MILPNTELVEYSSATAMAEAYERETNKIRSLIVELGEACGRLRDAFDTTKLYSFDFAVDIKHYSESYHCCVEGANDLIAKFKRDAWRGLINKLDIRKLMSAKAQAKLDDQLNGRSRYGNEPVEELPEITSDNILSVISGMIASAGDFLEEKIREEYEFWKPHRERYATDNVNVLDEKVIKGYMVNRRWDGTWDSNNSCERRAHLIALDSIMHMLDGQGIPAEYDGDLLTAILQSEDGKGESRYFKFACFHNGNIHLRFKRKDLLAQFNLIAGGASLGQVKERSRGTTAV